MVYRIYVEKKPGFDVEANGLKNELTGLLGIRSLTGLRLLNRYDVEGIDEVLFHQCVSTVFSEPPVDNTYAQLPEHEGTAFAVEYLPGQFDQRADSAAECIQLISQGERPLVRSARVYLLEGALTDEQLAEIKKYVINPVEAREASLDKKATLKMEYPVPTAVAVLDGFNQLDEEGLKKFIDENGLAMDLGDIKFCQEYFRSEQRDPTITEIKMAQGAKPGEGGHLPAKKVYPWIAKTRHSTPGVSLISPPPHHDIYSIEDLAQLIYDLKNANKYADISVKLVSEAGVGTVAAGVAKAGAQTILISGYDGGTGAAPRSSIHNAGLPWELGLAETHQTLLKNGLRNRVRIETDGKLMSGRDVAIAALMGAEEFGFATAPLVTMGCVMMRVCNLDTCPVGVATQNPELRKRFKGKPEYVENFMRFIAQELREYMSKLGFRTVSEMVGRTDLLVQTDNVQEPHQGKVDLSAILNNPFAGKDQKVTFDPKAVYNFELEKTMDEKVLVKKCANAINKGQKTELSVNLTNIDRTFGTILGAEITRKNKNGLADDTITVHCNGAGGQSFGAFIPKGLTLELTGDSNDYFGKGLSGGKLILRVPEKAAYKAEENIIVGNVALYGATSGTAFINGVAGERFAVRNSGASAVVEGVGEHGCEYMTGGRVVVLGKTGKNFAAGMSGGIAYVLDVDNVLYKNLNKAMISIEKVENKYDKKELRDLIEAHVEATGSKLGAKVLADFDYYLPHFKKLIPNEYKKMITLSAKLEEKGLNSQQAQMEAFYESIGAKH